MITLDVLGTPAPKGSSRAILVRGRAVNVPGSSDVGRKKLKGWDANVRASAIEQLGERSDPVFVDQPLYVEIVFRMARPAGHWSKRKDGAGGLMPSAPCAPATKPDIDKLARATLDSMTGLVFDDDSRIVRLVVAKEYARPGHEGARIKIAAYRPGMVGVAETEDAA